MMVPYCPDAEETARNFDIINLAVRTEFKGMTIICDGCLKCPIIYGYTKNIDVIGNSVDFCERCYKKLLNAKTVEERVEIIKQCRLRFPLMIE